MADDDITRRRSERAHTAILEATVALLREDGYPNLRLDAVAARARVGKTTIYRWWPGKALLAIEALQTLVDPPHVTFSGDSRTDVQALVTRVAEVWAEPPVFGTLLFRRMRGDPVDDVVDELADLVVAGRRPRVTPAP